MKRIILQVILGISLIVNLLLGINSIKNKSIYEHTRLDEINRNENIIPNEETAERIANAVIDAQDSNKGWGKIEEYDIEVSFDKKRYEWIVSYLPKAEGYVIFDGGITVRIRKDNGRVLIYRN